MQLVEKHMIRKSDSRYDAIDKAAFAGKSLYNAALYEMRQSFIHQGKYIYYNQMDKIMQKHEAYRGLHCKVSQQVLKQLAHDWESFFPRTLELGCAGCVGRASPAAKTLQKQAADRFGPGAHQPPH